MQEVNHIKLITIIVLLFSLLGSIHGAVCAQDQPAENTIIEVGMWVSDIKGVDLASSSFNMDFYLLFEFNPSEISLDQVRKFTIVNIAIIDIDLSINEVEANEQEGVLIYQVIGAFTKNFDIQRYPFETHTLEIIIEYSGFNSSFVSYKVGSKIKVDESVNIAGWELGDYKTEISEKAYFDNSYSRFIFGIDISRPWLSGIIKNILPLAIFAVMAMLAFLVPIEESGQRLALVSVILLSTITFHFALLSGLPPRDYLTFSDKIMLVLDLVFLYILTAVAYIMYLQTKKKDVDLMTINKRALEILIVLFAILLVGLIISF